MMSLQFNLAKKNRYIWNDNVIAIKSMSRFKNIFFIVIVDDYIVNLVSESMVQMTSFLDIKIYTYMQKNYYTLVYSHSAY